MATNVIILNLTSTQRQIKQHIQFNKPLQFNSFCKNIDPVSPLGNKALRHSDMLFRKRGQMNLISKKQLTKACENVYHGDAP